MNAQQARELMRSVSHTEPILDTINRIASNARMGGRTLIITSTDVSDITIRYNWASNNGYSSAFTKNYAQDKTGNYIHKIEIGW